MARLNLNATLSLEDLPPPTNPTRGCLPGTRQRILTTIYQWFEDPSTCNVLWLNDISGSGKSAIARHVAWEATHRRQLLCSFFFRSDIRAQSNTSSVVFNLSQQIARLGDPIAATIEDTRKLLETTPQISLADAFHAAVTVPLRLHPPEKSSLILVDALDESGTPTARAEFLAALTREIPLLPATVKVLLTSNPEQDIEQALDCLSPESEEEDTDGYRRLTFDVYGEENCQDLKRFIRHTFQKIADSKRSNGHVIPHDWPSVAQRRGLRYHANGLFLWAKVAAGHVSGSLNPQEALEGLLTLTTPPCPERAMDTLYGHILDSAPSSSGFDFRVYYDILEHVLAAPAPMSVYALSEAVRQDVLPTIRPLQAVLLYDPVVRVTHQSFREYVQCAEKCATRFLVKELRSAVSATPGLYAGFPLNRLATVRAYPNVEHVSTDVGSQLDPTSISEQPVARGAFGDVYKARYTDGLDVAIKSLRIYDSPDAPNAHSLEKQSARELEIWSRLDHPNVLGLLGICVFKGEIGMVSEWMPNDNVREYVNKHPSANRFELIADIAVGLKYLHDTHIVHGDLKGGNVVVSATRRCRLVDFGLAKLSEESLGVSTLSVDGTARWMAPELMNTERTKAPITSSSDVYALGMTILEIMTGKLPFQ
ncbi:hypothetical protein FRC07_001474, partial [Ceratobasidium sp. 392]